MTRVLQRVHYEYTRTYSYTLIYKIICLVFYHVFKFIIVAPVRRRESDTAQYDLWRTRGTLISGKSLSRADSGSEKDKPTERATTARRKAKTIDEPSSVRCYVYRCNGRCSLKGDAGSNVAGLHGDTLTLLRSSACTSVVAHAPAENQIFLQSGPVGLSFALRVAKTIGGACKIKLGESQSV